MHPTPSPRHPFKALMALVAMAACVHGVFAHVGPRHDTGRRIEIVTQSQSHAARANGEPARDCDDDDDADVPDSIFVETDDAEYL